MRGFLFPCIEIDVPELEGESAIEDLVRDWVGKFVHIHRSNNEQVARPGDRRRDFVDIVIAAVDGKLRLAPLHRRQKGREIMFDPCQIHLIKAKEIRFARILTSVDQQLQRVRFMKDRRRCERVDEAQKRAAI